VPLETFRILTVCTGNICRSPAMELLLAHALRDDPRFHVSSAGTHAMTGWPVNPPMDRLLLERGVEPVGEAQQATRRTLAASGLILTATQAHRSWIAEEEPRAVRRVFTMTEFADAIEGAPRDGAPRDLVEWAAAHRPALRVQSRGAASRRGYDEGDILDPYGRGDAAYVAALEQIEPLVERISRALLATPV
jgi:protein-tyrosine phosphatase